MSGADVIGAGPGPRRPEARWRRTGHATPRARRAGISGGRSDGDRGSASLWVLALGLLLVMAGGAGAAVGAARVARHEARVAADLGALGGAMRAIEGRGPACARAAEVVAANRGRLVGCTMDGLDLVVRVEVDVTVLRGLRRTATAAARAGPVAVT